MATKAGAGMRDDNILLSFARMIRLHIIKSVWRQALPFSELIKV